MLSQSLKPILKSSLSLILLSAEKVVEWVSELDGISQSWVVTPDYKIPPNTAFNLKIGFMATKDTGNSWLCLLVGGGANNFRVSASKSFSEPAGVTLTIGTDQISIKTPWVYYEYAEVFVTRDATGSGTVKFKGESKSFTNAGEIVISRAGRDGIIGGNDYLGGFVKSLEVEVEATLDLNITFTDKDQGQNQKSTVSNHTAYMPNYTAAVWKDKSKL